MIENFRQAAGLGNIYRSASTDVLGEFDASQLEDGADKFVVKKPGLILDLRADNEINEAKVQKWITEHGIQLIEYSSYTSFEKRRALVRMAIITPATMLAYMTKEWELTSEEKEKAAEAQKSGSIPEQKELVCAKLNERGLFGLNQIILDSGAELCKALMLITRRFEANADDVILIHCVLGKDRTGMLVMLLQSLSEFSDEIIINDYTASDNKSSHLGPIEAEMNLGELPYGKLDRAVFSSATKEAMVLTLEYLRQKYGSISPGYLEHIGFNNMWRRRLRCCLKASHSSTNNSRMYW